MKTTASTAGADEMRCCYCCFIGIKHVITFAAVVDAAAVAVANDAAVADDHGAVAFVCCCHLMFLLIMLTMVKQ